jgi:hypothetical protein
MQTSGVVGAPLTLSSVKDYAEWKFRGAPVSEGASREGLKDRTRRASPMS